LSQKLREPGLKTGVEVAPDLDSNFRGIEATVLQLFTLRDGCRLPATYSVHCRQVIIRIMTRMRMIPHWKLHGHTCRYVVIIPTSVLNC